MSGAEYLVCDYCGHVEMTQDADDRPARKCESCGLPLNTSARFDWLGNAEDYSQAVIEGRAGEGRR